MNNQNKVSVFLVDDNELFLKTLESSLSERFNSEIEIRSFVTGEVCLKEMQQDPNAAADIVILDYHLNTEIASALNGLDVLKKIKKENNKTIVIMLSAEDKLHIAMDCISNGAFEFVLKSETAFIRTQNIMKNSLEKEFNSRILKITMNIMEKHPELYKYIEEMSETIPDSFDPEVNLKNLKTYYDSLNAMLNKYVSTSVIH
jgi:two-component system OmpR family response regulator